MKANQNYENLCNTGIMLVKTKYLKEKLKKVKNSNSKKEFYLTDLVEIFNNDGQGFTFCIPSLSVFRR